MPKYRIVQSERQRSVENQSTFAEVTAEEKYPIFDSQCMYIAHNAITPDDGRQIYICIMSL